MFRPYVIIWGILAVLLLGVGPPCLAHATHWDGRVAGYKAEQQFERDVSQAIPQKFAKTFKFGTRELVGSTKPGVWRCQMTYVPDPTREPFTVTAEYTMDGQDSRKVGELLEAPGKLKYPETVDDVTRILHDHGMSERSIREAFNHDSASIMARAFVDQDNRPD